MNGELDSDNLDAEIDTNTQQVTIEPSYLNYLREHGYTIDGLNEVHTVQRDKSKTPHLVLNVETYEKPKDHPNLDYAADSISLWVCDCWAWRNQSADVSSGERPSECEPCVHIKQVDKVERAKADNAQDTL